MNTTHRQLRTITIGAGIALTLALLTLPAHADDSDSGATVLGPFDLTDGHGLKISQYQLSIDEGGTFSPLQMIYATALTFTWDIYRFCIGFIAYLVDWATTFTWVSWITGPMHAAEQALRDQVLAPLQLTSISQGGVMGLLLVLAGATAAFHMLKGRPGRGLVEVLSSGAAAALAVGLFSSPVLLFAGDGTSLAMPLQVAQRTGVELSNTVTGSGATPSPDTSGESPAPADGAGTMITDTFIRPVHQIFNYGQVIDLHSPECAQVYDKVLKAGPNDDGAEEVRQAVGRCDKTLKTYADDDSWSRLIGLGIYGFTAAVLGVLVLVFVVLLMMAVLTLTWASLKLLVHAPMAILPGDSRGPGLRDLVDVLTSLVFLVTHLVLLSILIRLIRGVLTATETVPLQIRFVGIDLLLLAATGLLIASHINQRRGARSMAQRLRDRLKLAARNDRPSLASKATRWLTQPSYGATYGQLSNGMRRSEGGRSSGMRRLNRLTASNGYQLAAAAGRLGAGTVTGGASIAATTAVRTATTAAVIGRTTSRATQAGYRAIQTGARTHKAVQYGAQRATTGSQRADRALEHSARAHNYIHHHTKRAAATTTTRAVLATGLRPRSTGDPAPGTYSAAAPEHTTSTARTRPSAPATAPASARPSVRPATSRLRLARPAPQSRPFPPPSRESRPTPAAPTPPVVAPRPPSTPSPRRRKS